MAEHDPHSPPSGFPETAKLDLEIEAGFSRTQSLFDAVRQLLRPAPRSGEGDWLDTTVT